MKRCRSLRGLLRDLQRRHHQRELLLQNASPCDPSRSVRTTSPPAPRSASAHRVALSRKNGSCVPATRVGARHRARHRRGRPVAGARRGGEDHVVDVGMAEPHGERELGTRRHAEHRGPVGGQFDREARTGPQTHVIDEELLVCREPFGIEGERGCAPARRVLLQPQRRIIRTVCADDHREWEVGGLEDASPGRSAGRHRRRRSPPVASVGHRR